MSETSDTSLDLSLPSPKHYRPRIAIIGCGRIIDVHLRAYREANWDVVALADEKEEKAVRRRDEFYPTATIHRDYRRMLEQEDFDVVDVAGQPTVRAEQIENALLAGKHVLSQKPFVTDLATGRRLADLADRCNVRLAVNQNARWAPYFFYIRQAVRAGLLGRLETVDLHLNWDHTWIKGTAPEKSYHPLLFDFAIHWLDIIACLFGGRRPAHVWAATARVPGQEVLPDLLGQVAVAYADGLATVSFNGLSKYGGGESVIVTGSRGAIRGRGGVCTCEDVQLCTDTGTSQPALQGHWFPDGFRGAMGELLCAIEEKRQPENSARNNLASMEICFAAIASAESGRTVSLEQNKA